MVNKGSFENKITEFSLVFTLPKAQILPKLIELKNEGKFNDQNYFLKVIDDSIANNQQEFITSFFIPTAVEQKYPVLGSILFKCIKEQYIICIKNILNLNPLVEFEGKNILHLAAELDDNVLIVLAPKKTLYLHLRDKQMGQVPSKYVRSPRMAEYFEQRFKLERSQTSFPKELQAHLLYMQKSLNVGFRDLRHRIDSMFIDSSWYPKSLKMDLIISSKNFVFEDSFRKLNELGNVWYSPSNEEEFLILFKDGNVAVGIKKWISLLLKAFFKAKISSRQIRQPLFGLIRPDSSLYAPNHNYSPKYYKFAGSIVALAIKYAVPVEIEFIPSIYRVTLGIEPVRIEDFSYQHPKEYETFKTLRETCIRHNTFTIYDHKKQTNVRINSLKDYDDQLLQNVSKMLYYQHKLSIDAFAEGFRSKIPRQMTKYLDLTDLKHALKG